VKTKQEIRNYYLKKRAELSYADVNAQSMLIADLFFATVNLEKANYIHIFIPIAKFNEVNTWHIIRKIWADHPRIKTLTSITHKSGLTHVEFNANTHFEENKWGVPIPKNMPEINATNADIIITPLLAFDEHFHRVGYGKGYYDAFFSQCRPDALKIGLSLFPPLKTPIPEILPTDVALDKVIWKV